MNKQKSNTEEIDTINDHIDMFTFNEDKVDEQEDIDLSEYDFIDSTVHKEEDDGDDEEEDEDPNELNFDEISKGDDEEEDDGDEGDDDDEDYDLAELNKKLGKDYKSIKDLKKALSDDKSEGSEDSEEKELESISNTLSIYQPLIQLNDDDLMRKQFETIALHQEKDLNDEDVQIEIEEQVQDLIDSRTLYLRAKDLRQTLENKIINPALDSKKAIEKSREEREQKLRTTEREQLQESFAEIFGSKSFFGIKPTKDKIVKAYKDVDSGEFLKRISSDKKIQARLAMLLEYEEPIFKKASGLTFGEGMKAVLDEFKSKKDSNTLSRAQRKGSSAGSDKSRGLLQDLLYENPDKEARKNKV